MAKPLVFNYDGSELSFAMSKVDRSKLYGYKEIEVLDDKGQRCDLATLAGDGKTVVGRGGVAMAYVSVDGEWCDRGALKPVDLEGQVIKPVPSSFAAPVPLGERATVEEYLDHNIRAVYQMQTDDDASALVEELRQGAIFKFPYSFRGGLEADAGFLLLNDDGHVFLAVGNPTSIEFVGLQQPAGLVEEDETTDEDDELDFDMI